MNINFAKSTRWILGWDSNINFWLDNWTSNGPLRSLVHGPLTRREEELKIREIVSDTGWDRGKIFITLPSHVGMEIRVMPCSCVASMKDRMIWVATSNEHFNLNSAYLLSNQISEPHLSFNGNWIWKLNVLLRV